MEQIFQVIFNKSFMTTNFLTIFII